MRSRLIRRFAWVVWTLTAAFSILSLPLAGRGDLVILLPLAAWALTTSTVGTIVAVRRPENAVGWILCVIGLLWASNGFFVQYAMRALVADPGSLPAGEAAAWISTWVVIPTFGLLAFLFLLFPDGRPLSRRWHLLLWINGFLIAASVVVSARAPGPIAGLKGIRNPLGLEGYGGSLELVGNVLFDVGDVLVFVSVVSVFLRLRHADRTTRQQIKWLAFAAALLAIVVMITLVGDLLFGGFGLWAFVLVIVAFFGLPLSIGVAVLRYRLYEIDIIINRTLVYGTLTVTLLAVYFGGVATAQLVLRTLTGQERAPQLVVVISTLVIAALFNPARRRVQDFIDRRFYRRKYDARKTLAAFSKKLRDETDVDALNSELLSTVRETVQPEHVSLWLREPEKSA